MKKLFVAFFALAALAACAKEEIVSLDKGEAIQFGNAFVENATRAADKSYSGDKALTAFNLYGTVTGTNGTINIYNGCTVTGEVGYKVDANGDVTEDPNVWTCPVNQYWIAGATYAFAAVADGTVATTDTNGMPLTLTCNTAVDANNVQKDLLYAEATATGKASGNGKVNFSFSHLLSKAQFTVKSNTQGDYYYSVKNINVNNFVNGTYYIKAVDEIAAGTWVGTGEKANTAFGNINDVRATDANGKTCEFQRLLIPTTAAFTVSCTIELWNANGDAADVKLATENKTFTVNQDLVAGHAYDFNLSLSVGELIEFTVTEKPTWNPTTGGTGVTL